MVSSSPTITKATTDCHHRGRPLRRLFPLAMRPMVAPTSTRKWPSPTHTTTRAAFPPSLQTTRRRAPAHCAPAPFLRLPLPQPVFALGPGRSKHVCPGAPVRARPRCADEPQRHLERNCPRGLSLCHQCRRPVRGHGPGWHGLRRLRRLDRFCLWLRHLWPVGHSDQFYGQRCHSAIARPRHFTITTPPATARPLAWTPKASPTPMTAIPAAMPSIRFATAALNPFLRHGRSQCDDFRRQHDGQPAGPFIGMPSLLATRRKTPR